jgi:hypothetical protein
LVGDDGKYFPLTSILYRLSVGRWFRTC